MPGFMQEKYKKLIKFFFFLNFAYYYYFLNFGKNPSTKKLNILSLNSHNRYEIPIIRSLIELIN